MARAALLALALTATSVSVARAGPLFDAYLNVCVKSGAEANSALAAADASGWMPIPQSLLAPLGVNAGIEGVQGRMKSDSAAINMVLVGHKKLPLGGSDVEMRFCAVATSSTPAEPLKAELDAWAAVPPLAELAGPGRTGYAFTDKAGVHTLMTKPDDEKAKALARSGSLNMAVIQEGKGMNLLAFAVPTM